MKSYTSNERRIVIKPHIYPSIVALAGGEKATTEYVNMLLGQVIDGHLTNQPVTHSPTFSTKPEPEPQDDPDELPPEAWAFLQ